MFPTAGKLVLLSAALGLLSVQSMGAIAVPRESEAKVVARLYRDYAWQSMASQPELFGRGIADETRSTLEKYFTPAMAKLFSAESACGNRRHEICNLDFDPLFRSQDPRVTDLEVIAGGPGKARVQFKDPVTNETTTIEFTLVLTKGRWRISDINYGANAEGSLRRLLAQPVPND